MRKNSIVPDQCIAQYVSNILVYHDEQDSSVTNLPFFADGYPGLIYHTAVNNMSLQPSGQVMKPFFIYGQTLHPIELIVNGAFQMVIFQMFPFALRSLFQLDALSLNDDCYDLTVAEASMVQQLEEVQSTDQYIALISTFISRKISSIIKKDELIKACIKLILDSNGTIQIKTLTEKLALSERTLQRLFKMETGISPKRFSKIIQFQASMDQLSKEEFLKLSDVAYRTGFADQSHFIRIFKQYTGNTPSFFVR